MSQHLITASEITGMIAAADGELRMAILLGCYAGLRYGEILALRWCDIDWEKKILHVCSKNGGRGRQIPMHPALENCLSHWRFQLGPRRGTHVFSPPSVKVRLRLRLRRLAAQLKLQGVAFYDFRHWFALMVVRGVDLNSAAALLGHAPRTVQLRYVQARPKRTKSRGPIRRPKKKVTRASRRRKG